MSGLDPSARQPLVEPLAVLSSALCVALWLSARPSADSMLRVVSVVVQGGQP